MSQTKLLFTGESQYQVQEALRFWKEQFIKKYGESWVRTFFSDSINLDAIKPAIMWSGLFSEKSLTVIYGIPKDNTSTNKVSWSNSESTEPFLIKHRDDIPASNIVILVSYKPDKRTKSRKYFSTNATIKSFPKKKGKDLTLFVLWKCVADTWAENKKSLLNNKQAESVVATVWNDLYMLHYECDKIVNYCEHHALDSIDDIALEWLICSHAEHDSFKILDAMRNDQTKAIQLIEKAQANQQNEYEFLCLLQYQKTNES